VLYSSLFEGDQLHDFTPARSNLGHPSPVRAVRAPSDRRRRAAIAAAVGLFLGLANGYAMAQAGLGVRGVGGIVGAVFVVTTLGAACAAAWQSGWLRIAWRVAGSWIAASGLLLLGWSLR
jgi:hypothetical protein